MKKVTNLHIILFCALMLTSCTDKQSSTDHSDLSSSFTQTESTVEVQSETTTLDSAVSVEITTTTEEIVTTESTETTAAPTEQHSEEEDLETPDPMHFNYRFSATSVGARLAGGNYQVMEGDFESVLDDNGEVEFRLIDYNFDGKLDLEVPVGYGTSNVRYSIYVWNPETLYFESTPITILNPKLNPKEKTVTCTISESATVKSFERYAWNGYHLELQTVYQADYEKLTLTETDMTTESGISTPNVQTFAAKEALETAFLSLQ